MRNKLMKKRLEYTMLIGIIVNALSFFLPIVSITLKSETKHYTEGYSVGSLVKLLVPAVLNGDKGELSNPPLALMAVMLFGLICWIASLFTVVLVFQSMRAKKVNLFRTIAVSIFELLSGLFFLVLAAQIRTFAVKIAVEPFFGHIGTGFGFFGLICAIATIGLAFANIYMLLNIIRSGEDFDEIEEEKDERSYDGRERAAARRPEERPVPDYDRQPRRNPTADRPPQRTPARNNLYSGQESASTGEARRPDDASRPSSAGRPSYDGQRAPRPSGATGVIDRDHLPRQSGYAAPARRPQPTQSTPTAAEYVVCARCGAKCRKGSRYCNICGEQIVRQVRKCMVCGETITEKDVFCPSCGTNIR